MVPPVKQLVVKSYHPWRKWVVLAVAVVSLPLAGWGLFEYGRYRAGFDGIAAAQESRTLRNTIDDLQEGNDMLRQQVATSERAREIDKQAYSDVNASLESMQNEISELKEEVAFYRGIVSPKESGQGVQVQTLQLVANGGDHAYSYKLVLVQTNKVATLTKGEVKITLQGLQNQAQKEYSFDELSGQDGHDGKFKFKYFEKTVGDIILPADFIPIRVVVHVTVRSPKRSDVEAVFAWQDVAT